MRHRLLLLFVAALTLGLMAVPAAAQTRDPFDPLVTEGGTGAADPGTGDDEGGSGPGTAGGAPVLPDTAEGLPDTGGDPSDWLVIAYVLVATGAGALLVARLSAPEPLPRRRRDSSASQT